MKILLIQPPFTIFKTETKKCHPPIGLAYLAAALNGRHEVAVLDALAEGYENEIDVTDELVRYGLSFEDIKAAILAEAPDVVGVSVPFSAQVDNVRTICRMVKETDKKVITILGGAHPSSEPGSLLEDGNVDFVVIGEGEDTLSELLTRIDKSSDFADLEGIGFKKDCAIKVNPKKHYREDLDSLPFPDWDSLPIEKYFKINNPHGSPARRVPFFPMVTSRGCPFECIFCSIHNLWGRNYRKRSAANVLAEIGHLVKRFGVKELLFEDDNLTLDRARAMAIFCGMIDKGCGLSWNVPNGVAVQTLDDEVLTKMRDSGCYAISIGVESGDERVLKDIIRKPINLSAIEPVVRKARSLGMETSAFFVVGLPGEGKKELKKTFRFAESLGADSVNFFFATPLPGTRLLEVCRASGLVKDGEDRTRLKSDYPSFSTAELPVDYLASAVSRERIRLYFLYLLRDPGRFFMKLWKKLVTGPEYFLKFLSQYRKLERMR